jgi:hypothetical protein
MELYVLFTMRGIPSALVELRPKYHDPDDLLRILAALARHPHALTERSVPRKTATEPK